MALFKSILIVTLILVYSPFIKGQQTLNKSEALDKKEQSLVLIAALAGKGDLPRLHTAFNEGLNTGWTINELKEAMVQLYAYAGFPRSLNGLNTLRTVVDERKKKGITDELGKVPSPLPTDKTKLEQGTELQAKLLGSSMKTSTADFAPVIDVFLKEHLFWDIFGRDNLDFKTRELITISTLAGLGGADNQLKSHIGVSMYNGITEPQLNQFVAIVQIGVGAKEGEAANKALQAVLNQKQTEKAGAKVVNSKAAVAIKEERTNSENATANSDLVFPKGEKITSKNFTGTTWLQSLVDSDSLNDIKVGNVTFAPGARTAWHFHTSGQILLVTKGTGYYQEKGSSKRILHKGDVVKCPPNLLHWHGASKDDEFVQVAITSTSKGETVWLQPVTDDEYKSLSYEQKQ